MLSFFPLDVLDGILNLIESVSEGFPTNSYTFSFIDGHVFLEITAVSPRQHLCLNLTVRSTDISLAENQFFDGIYQVPIACLYTYFSLLLRNVTFGLSRKYFHFLLITDDLAHL